MDAFAFVCVGKDRDGNTWAYRMRSIVEAQLLAKLVRDRDLGIEFDVIPLQGTMRAVEALDDILEIMGVEDV